MQRKQIKKITITAEELKVIVKDSDLPVSEIERGAGMPKTTLDKCLKERPDESGYVRKLPSKYIAPMLKFIKKRKAEKEELKLELKDTFIDLSIPLPPEPKVEIPNETSKQDWIDKLQEAKAELN